MNISNLEGSPILIVPTAVAPTKETPVVTEIINNTIKEKLDCKNHISQLKRLIHDHFIMYFKISPMIGDKFMIEYPIQRPQ